MTVMWFAIFAAIFVAAVAGVLYITSRLLKIGFVNKILSRITGERRWAKRMLAFVIVIILFAVGNLFFSVINVMIILIHLLVFWVVGDLITWIIGKIRGKEFKGYYTAPVVIIFSIIYLSVGWYLAHHVVETDYTLTTDKSIDNLKIAVFSDSHLGSNFDADGLAQYVEEINKTKPDIVFIVGDYVDDGTDYDNMVEGCKALSKLESKYGTYFVYGNHDKGYFPSEYRGYTDRELEIELKKNNVKVLADETELVDDSFYVIGRKDRSAGERMSIEELTKDLDKSKYMIVLDHQPKEYDQEVEAETDLVISGHTHGGQLFPFNNLGSLTGLDDKTYGWEVQDKTNFIVSSGISDWEINFKTGTIAEYLIINIK